MHPRGHMTDVQHVLNARVYHARGIHRWYTAPELDLAETAALLRHQPRFAGRDVLDIGIGAGRTSRHLAPLARRYVGTDYSPAMVEYARRTLPSLDIRLMDMRDLSPLEHASFDFVLASCNVLDAVGHEERDRALREMHRVLRPGGTLMFSSHNRALRDAWRGPRLAIVRNPGTQAAQVVRYARSLVNHARVRRHRVETADYAILNDEGHDYSVLHYYVRRETQQRHLEAIGFTTLDVFDTTGALLGSDADDTRSPSLLYVAQRT